MKRFIEGEARAQVTLLPECLDDYITEENPVRVVDVFVDELDMGALGFEGVDLNWPNDFGHFNRAL
ncbi:transposase [Pseudomonas synxantha]|uniref:Transposase n=1 Tax=Pseudomonas synxantha TaxID=47883 RepID=A0ACC6JVA2_9PSED|nr:transposase [Pseudomonas synxantha]